MSRPRSSCDKSAAPAGTPLGPGGPSPPNLRLGTRARRAPPPPPGYPAQTLGGGASRRGRGIDVGFVSQAATASRSRPSRGGGLSGCPRGALTRAAKVWDGTLSMRCACCVQEFTAKTSRRRFCSAKCRAAPWQANREHALAQVQGIHQRRPRPGPMPTGGRSGS